MCLRSNWPAARRVYGIGDGLGSLSISLSAQDRAGCLVSPAVEAATRRVPAGQARTQESFSLTSFHDSHLTTQYNAITRALAEEKYLTPTPIQVQTIPTVMTGRDVIGIAQTGTGKPRHSHCRFCTVSPSARVRRHARAAESWCSARRASCPAQSATASTLTATSCASEPRWGSTAYRWASRFATCSMAWMFSSRSHVVSAPADSPPSKLRCSSEGCDQRRARQGSLHG